MNKLENDLIRILTRIEKLTNGLSSKDDIKYQYNRAIAYFNIAASSPNYKSFSNLIIERSSSCLRNIFENPKNVLINFKSYLEYLEFKSGTVQIEDEEGNEITVDDYQFVINEVTVDDQMREEFYKNDILQELIAYKTFFETFNQSFEEIIIPTTEKIALSIATIEIGLRGRFIKEGKSTDAFVKLLTNPFLTKFEIKDFKIEIGVTAQVAAHIFQTLNKEGIQNLTFESLDKLNCFYNKKTKLTTTRMKSELSKFNDKLAEGKVIEQKAFNETAIVINRIKPQIEIPSQKSAILKVPN